MLTVYAYTLYPVTEDELRRDRRVVTARRMGTLEGIRAVGGTPIPGSGIEIDARHLSHDCPGFTAPDFRPAPEEPAANDSDEPCRPE